MLVEMALSLLLALVFLASAIPKLRHPKGFILTVLEYHVLPPALGELYARLLPPLELFVALLLLTGTAVRSATAIISLLLISFTVGIGINLARGRDLDCGCFGEGGRHIGPGLLLQDLGLLATSVVLAAFSKGWLVLASWSLFHVSDFASATTPAALAVCAAVTAGCAAALPRSRRRARRWEAALGRGRRLHAKTTAD